MVDKTDDRHGIVEGEFPEDLKLGYTVFDPDEFIALLKDLDKRAAVAQLLKEGTIGVQEGAERPSTVLYTQENFPVDASNFLTVAELESMLSHFDPSSIVQVATIVDGQIILIPVFVPNCVDKGYKGPLGQILIVKEGE